MTLFKIGASLETIILEMALYHHINETDGSKMVWRSGIYSLETTIGIRVITVWVKLGESLPYWKKILTAKIISFAIMGQ